MTFSLVKDQALLIDGRKYWVNRYSGKTASLDGEDGEIVTKTLEEILELQSSGRLKGVSKVQARDLLAHGESDPDHLPDYEEIPKGDRLKAFGRHMCLKFILESGGWKASPEHLEPLLDEFYALNPEFERCSITTLYRAYRKFQRGNGHWSAQLPNTHRRGNRAPRLQREVYAMIGDLVERKYLTTKQLSVAAIYRKLQETIYGLNKERSESNKLIPPSKGTLYNIVNQLPKHLVVSKRRGTAEASQTFPSGYRYDKPTRPLERVEIDHTPVDIELIDEESGEPCGRVWVTMAIDVFTRCILGVYLSFEEPSINRVLGCVRHICLPKQPDAPFMQGLTWPYYGVPMHIVCDNGSEFHSQSYDLLLEDMGIVSTFCGRKRGDQKPRIENSFRILNEVLIHGLDGTTHSNPQKLGEYTPKKLACHTFTGFTRVLFQWICTVYHHRPSMTTGKTPHEMWQATYNFACLRLPDEPELVERLITRLAYRTLNKDAIYIDGIRYNSPDLAALRREVGNGLKLKVRYFDENLTFIEILHPRTRQAIRIPAEDQEYTRGVNRILHRMVRKRLREEIREKGSSPALMEAMLQLRSLIDDEKKKGRRIKRQAVMKARGISSSKPEGTIAIPAPSEEQIRTAFAARSLAAADQIRELEIDS